MIDEGCKRLPTVYQPVQVQQAPTPAPVDTMPSCAQLCNSACSGQACQNTMVTPSLRGVNTACGNQCTNWSSSICMKSNFNRYLKCIGKRTAKCYRQKWIVSKQCIN